MLKTYFLNARKLPMVVEPENRRGNVETLSQIAVERQKLLRSCLLKHGALLLRGFGMQTVEEFANFVRRFSGKDFFNYAGGVSPRIALSSGVYTSTEYPPHLPLTLHNELSYSPKFPRHLYFFCETAPEKGGATTLGDSRQILRKINPKTVGLFKHKKVRYNRLLTGEKGSGYSWQDAFETSEREAVEKHCREIEAEFEWTANGGLRLSQTCPATAFHPETGEEVWFNQADGFHAGNLDEESRQTMISNGEDLRLNSCFGDSSNIVPIMLEQIRAVLKAETIAHQWQKGDILILDNLLAAHGREPFSGLRKIALAMT